MNYKSVIIVTYGRSGSTLLMNLLNNSGCMIYGENSNFFYNLFNSYKSIKRLQRLNGGKISPWFNNDEFNNDVFINNIRNLIKNIYGDYDKMGFKEIRYNNNDIEKDNDFDNYLHFLEKIFDDVFFIFNTRNLDDVKKSKWWGKMDGDYVISLLKETEKRFYNYIQKNENNCFHIRYYDVINKTDRLKELYNRIGLEYNEIIIDKTLNKKYSV